MQPYERLKQILTETGLKQAEFAESIGTTKATISRQLSGIHKIDKQVALSIQAVYGYRANWLLTGELPKTGEGGMFLSDAGNTNEPTSVSTYKVGNKVFTHETYEDSVSLAGLSDEQRKEVLNFIDYVKSKKKGK